MRRRRGAAAPRELAMNLMLNIDRPIPTLLLPSHGAFESVATNDTFPAHGAIGWAGKLSEEMDFVALHSHPVWRFNKVEFLTYCGRKPAIAKGQLVTQRVCSFLHIGVGPHNSRIELPSIQRTRTRNGR